VLVLKSTIATRLILPLLVCGVLLLIIGTAIRFNYDFNREIRLLEKRVYEVEQSNVPALVNSVWLADWEMVRVQVEGIQALPEISRVEVVVDDREIAAVGMEISDRAVRHIFPLIKRYKEREVVLGALTLYSDDNKLRQRLYDSVLTELGIRLLTILLISFILFYLFHRLAGRHLVAMARQLSVLGQERIGKPLVLDKKPSACGKMDEIDQVIFSFNEMQQNLQRSFDEMRQTNEELVRENLERVRAEAALRESETRYSLLLNSIPEVFWMVSADFQQVLFVSPSYEQIWGRTCESLLAEPRDWLAAVVEEDQAGVAAVIDIVGKGTVEQIDFPEFRIRRPDGTLRWIKAKAVPLRDEKGMVWRIAGLCEDITERVRAEEEKARLESRLIQSQKMEAIGVLAGGIAHDFNNILAAIMGYTELAKVEVQPDSRLAQDLDKVLTSAHRAKELVKQILAFSRQSTVERMPIKIPPLVKESLKMLRASIPTTIAIKENFAPHCGPVMADPTQIHQIVMNLCTNAFHAMEKSGGVLSVDVKTTLINSPSSPGDPLVNPGEYVELTVSDTGTGIGLDVIDKIFDPYFTTKGVGKGTGMGLSIAHGIVKSYGGDITVESTLGQGTTLHVYFPVIKGEEMANEEIHEVPRGNERILLIDDEEILVEIGRDMLTKLGYIVTTQRSSFEALKIFINDPFQFDLVITDQTMPGMTGTELSRRMLKIRHDLPIILCTGFSNLVNEESAKAIGIREFMLKPINRLSIAQLIRKLLDGKTEVAPGI
jgi:PAS domain S-box-containing protein